LFKGITQVFNLQQHGRGKDLSGNAKKEVAALRKGNFGEKKITRQEQSSALATSIARVPSGERGKGHNSAEPRDARQEKGVAREKG